MLAALALLGGCSGRAPVQGPQAAAAPARDVAPLLGDAGIGPIRFGMTLAQAQAAAGGKAAPRPADPACSMLRFASLPGVRFMVENGTVTRADADPGTGNVLGIAVGDTMERVRASYPNVKVSRHKYLEGGHVLTFPSADGGAAIVMEVEGGKVARIRAGRQPAVAYVETCG